MIDEALVEDEFDVAKRMGKLGSQMAKPPKDRELALTIATKNKEVEAAAKAYAIVATALTTLKLSPDDPDANFIVGKHLCRNGRWAKGLPLLALGSDAALKAAAVREIKGADTPEEQVKLADGWWNIGQDSRGEWRAAVLLHAGTWYQEAQPNLASALLKGLVEKRLAEIAGLGHK